MMDTATGPCCDNQ